MGFLFINLIFHKLVCSFFFHDLVLNYILTSNTSSSTYVRAWCHAFHVIKSTQHHSTILTGQLTINKIHFPIAILDDKSQSSPQIIRKGQFSLKSFLCSTFAILCVIIFNGESTSTWTTGVYLYIYFRRKKIKSLLNLKKKLISKYNREMTKKVGGKK